MKFLPGKRYRFKEDFDTERKYHPVRYFAKKDEIVIFKAAQRFSSQTWVEFKTENTPSRKIILTKKEAFNLLEEV